MRFVAVLEARRSLSLSLCQYRRNGHGYLHSSRDQELTWPLASFAAARQLHLLLCLIFVRSAWRAIHHDTCNRGRFESRDAVYVISLPYGVLEPLAPSKQRAHVILERPPFAPSSESNFPLEPVRLLLPLASSVACQGVLAVSHRALEPGSSQYNFAQPYSWRREVPGASSPTYYAAP